MVELMLRGLQGDTRFETFHVDAWVSDDLEDVGGFRLEKLWRLLKFCLQAIRIRWRHGPMDFYYVPAPAKKSAILRDWMVMLLVRPWFRRTVFHWHAFGLGHWATGTTEYPAGERHSQTGKSEVVVIHPPSLFGRAEGMARWITRWLLGRADLSIVLTEYNCRDAQFLQPEQLVVVPNGIPDPCRDFVENVLPVRRKRAEEGYPGPLRLLFLGHCMETKGLLTAVRILVELRRQSGREAVLTVAGKFPSQEEREKFDSLVAGFGVEEAVQVVGFADEPKKRELFMKADLLLFPTQYPPETFGLVVIEAMAFGVPALVSAWRGVPELLPEGSPARNPGVGMDEQLAVLNETLKTADPMKLREHFLRAYSLDAFRKKNAEMLKGQVHRKALRWTSLTNARER